MATAMFGSSASGGNPFGTKVDQIPMPQPFSDLSSIYPNLSGANAQISSNIMSALKGQLSPETVAAIQDNAARFGVQSGMPGSGLARNLSLRDLGLATEQRQQQGIQEYGSILPVISGTQTVRPETQYEINFQNAINRAAPDPGAAASYAQQLYNQYLKNSRSPAGGTGESSFWGGPGNNYKPFLGGQQLPEPFWQRF